MLAEKISPEPASGCIVALLSRVPSGACCAVVTTIAVTLCGSAFSQDCSPVVERPKVRIGPAEVRVLNEKSVRDGARTITYQLVEEPTAPAPSLPTTTPSPVVAVADAQRAAKMSAMLFVFATVYDHSITALRWRDEDREYRAFSNLDFNQLRGVHEFETGDTIYTLMMAIGDESSLVVAEAQRLGLRPTVEQLPSPGAFDGMRPQYLLTRPTTAPATSAGLAAMDALHAFCAANRNALLEAARLREAARVASERMPATPPPTPKDQVITFWRVERVVSPTTPTNNSGR